MLRVLDRVERLSIARPMIFRAMTVILLLYCIIPNECRSEGAFFFGQASLGYWSAGTAKNSATTSEAQTTALNNCRRSGYAGAFCKLILTFSNTCFAYAVGIDANTWGGQTAENESRARQGALSACQKFGFPCSIRDSFCDTTPVAQDNNSRLAPIIRSPPPPISNAASMRPPQGIRRSCSELCQQTWAECTDAANKDFQWRWSFFRDSDISLSDRNAENRKLNEARREDLNACRSDRDSCRRECDE